MRTRTARSHRAAAVAVALTVVGLAATACGFDASSAAEQRHQCRSADVGTTTRATIRAALGGPTVTRHETVGGHRRVVDVYLDGHVGFGFDRATGVLREKDCAAGGG
jgi:hypothetical protein